MAKITRLDLERRDTAQALTLVLLLAWLFTGHNLAVYLAMGFLVLGMAAPRTMTLPAKLWFGFSRLLGGVMSRLILSLIYFLIVCPVAVIRRALGRDPLRLREWKRSGTASVFVKREHGLSRDDLQHPY